jgi:hypothetical protein
MRNSKFKKEKTRVAGRRGRALVALAASSLLLAGVAASADAGQRGAGPQAPAAPANARAAAPVDLTGYWVSIVTEDWIERMSPDSPPSGTGGRDAADRAAGGGRGRGAAPPPAGADPCRVYGAGGSMRVPGRLNITWADDNTLKIDMDAGTQTRLLRFGQVPPPTQRTLQGHSVASWDTGARAGGFGGRGGAAPPAPRWGQLRAVTTNTTGGYLLSSRNTYSENAVITENFIAHSDFGENYLTVMTSIEDGGNPRIVSSTFKKEPNGSKFKPTGCDVVR